LLAASGEVSDFAALCGAVWDGALPDQHRIVALRTHVHSTRRKLAAVGAADALISEPGRGYR
jgi:DNA-binding response OmpR family regulator